MRSRQKSRANSTASGLTTPTRPSISSSLEKAGVLSLSSSPVTPGSPRDSDASLQKPSTFCALDEVSPVETPLPAAPPVRPKRTPLRVAAEVQQVILHLDEVCGRPSDWQPDICNIPPFIGYFHRAVSRVTKSIRRQVAQDKAQRGIHEWLSKVAEEQEPKKDLDPAQREENMLCNATRTSQFWSQMRSAASHGVKDNKGTTKWADKVTHSFPRASRELFQPQVKLDAWDEAFDQLVDGPWEIRTLWDEVSDEAKQFTTPTTMRDDPHASFLPELLPSQSPFVVRRETIDKIAAKKRKSSKAKPSLAVAPQRPTVHDLCRQMTELRKYVQGEEDERLDGQSTPRSEHSGASPRLTRPGTRQHTIVSEASVDSDESPTSTAMHRSPASRRSFSRRSTGRSFHVRDTSDDPLAAPGIASRLGSMVPSKTSQSGVSPPETPTSRHVRNCNEWRPAALGEWLLSPEVTEYFEAHAGMCVVPTKQVFLASADVRSVDLSNKRLSDDRLALLAKPVASRSGVLKEIDVSCNLVKDSLATLIKALLPPPPVWAREDHGNTIQLDLLDISQNPLSVKSIRALAEVIRTKRLSVKELRVNSTPISQEGFQLVCAAICKSRCASTTSFADIHCGRHRQDMCQYAARLCLAVSDIDLSYNYFREEGLNYLGQALCSQHAVCRRLSLAENAGCSDMRETKPMHLFCEVVGDNRSLTSLDLSGCYLEQRSAICLEDSLQVHPCLEHLDVSRNPLGQAGLRAVLRSVSERTTQLGRLTADELRLSIADPMVTYNPADIAKEFRNGHELKLWRPYHRAILRLSISQAERFGSSCSALQHFTLDGNSRKATFPRGQSGRLKVPTDGVAEFSFMLRAPAVELSSGSDAVMSTHRRQRISASLTKVVALVRFFRQQKDEDSRRSFLLAASRDLCFTPAQVKFFIKEAEVVCPEFLSKVSTWFYTTLERTEWSIMTSSLRNSNFIASGTKKCVKQASRTLALQQICALVRINFDALTGHHTFNLCHATGYSAAERVFTAAQWEATTATKRNLLDNSEVGHHIGIRNFRFDPSGAEAAGAAVTQYRPGWVLPGDGFSADGQLSFDYVTPIRLDKKKATAVSKAQVSAMASVLRGDGSDVSKGACFQALQQVAHKFCLNAGHVRELLAAMTTMEEDASTRSEELDDGTTLQQPSSSWVQDLYVMLFPRCLEFGSLLNDSIRGVLHDEAYFGSQDFDEVQQRLGMPNTFDAMNVHKEGHNRFKFDLSKRDHRICFDFLIKLVTREEAVSFKDCHYTELFAKSGNNDWVMPDIWRTELPHQGIVTLRYGRDKLDKLPPAEKRMRRELAQELLGWMNDKLGSPRK